MAKDGRAALAEISGRAGGDQIAGQVDEPPEAIHPAGPHGQVPFPGQEPGQGILFQVGADRDARCGARIGIAGRPVRPAGDGRRVFGTEQDTERARVAHSGRKRDYSVVRNRDDGRRAPWGTGQVEGCGQAVDRGTVADRQLAGADVGAGGQRPGRGWLAGRQERTRLAGAGHVEMVPGPGAGHEQDATFPLQVLGMRDGVLAFRGDRRRVRNQALLDADDRDGLEFQALHRVHGSGPNGLRAAAAVQRDRR